MPRLIRAAVYSVGFAVFFAAIGALGGFLTGLAVSIFDEVVRNRGNPQGPLLILLTGPLGAIIGAFYGWLKGFNHPGPIEGFWRRASNEQRP